MPTIHKRFPSDVMIIVSVNGRGDRASSQGVPDCQDQGVLVCDIYIQGHAKHR
jgi:hypothetical protein